MVDHELRARSEAVVRRFVGAMGQDLETMFACLAPDFVRYGADAGWLPMSKATYREMARDFQQPFPDCRWDLVQIVSAERRVAVELVESGTFTGAWTVGDVTVPANGARYEMSGAVFFEIDEDDLISSYRYLHTGAFTQVYADVMTEEFYVAYATAFLVPDAGAV